jgi:hypothetical protein
MELMAKTSDGVPTSQDDSFDRPGLARQVGINTILQETIRLRGSMPKINS